MQSSIKTTGSSTTGLHRHLTNAHPEDWVAFQEEQLSKIRKQDEGLLQLEKTNNKDDKFEDVWGGQAPCVLGRSIKKRSC